MIELRKVSKVFAGGIKAVDGVSLAIGEGSVVALLGPSGCGKTTTLRLINRLEEATAGEIWVRGRDVRGQRPEVLRRSIGYVIQNDGLFPHRDVSANVATVPRLLGWPRARVRRRVGEILDMVGLPEARFGPRLPSELSGGQRQRVGVARALAADPDLLLMDEPFAALDPGARASLQDEFVRLNSQLRKTVVLVTHDLVEASRMAGEIVLLSAGQVVQRGTLRDLLLRPADERVQGFLGRRGAELALGMLHLGQVVAGLATELYPVAAMHSSGGPVSQDRPQPGLQPAIVRHLSADLTLGRALAALDGAADNDLIAIDGGSGGAYKARALRQRILADLKGP